MSHDLFYTFKPEPRSFNIVRQSGPYTITRPLNDQPACTLWFGDQPQATLTLADIRKYYPHV